MAFSKMKSVFQTHKLLFAGLIFLGLCMVFLSCLIYLRMSESPPVFWIRWILAGSLLFSLIVLAGLLAFVYHSLIQPTKQVLTQKRFFEKDSLNLKSTLSQLAQGDFTKRLSVSSTPLTVPPGKSLAVLISIFNEIIASFQQISEEFNAVADIPCLRLCYIGANRFTEGRRCGEIMGHLLNGKGEVAVNVSSFLNTGHVMRYKGFQSYLNHHYPDIKIVAVSETKESDELTYTHVMNLIKKYPNFCGYYLTQGATPHSAARAVMDAGKSGTVKIIAHDCNDETMFYVKKGVIQATLGQNPLIQGHNPIIHLYNHLAAGWMPTTPLMYTHLDVVTPENYQNFWQEGVGEIQTQEIYNRMAKVMKNESNRPLRIVAIGRENSPFWNPVKKGVLQAAKTLKPYGATVEWIVPENSQKGSDIRASVYGPAMDSLVAQKVDGIAIVAADRDLIPYINRAVKAGVPVVTFNVDLESLRGMFHIIAGQSQKLKQFSQQMIGDMQTVSRSTDAIETEMVHLDKRASDQNAQIQNMRNSLNAFTNYMDQINRESNTIKETTDSVWNSLAVGTDALESTFESIQNIRQTIEKTWKTADTLNRNSEKIESIVKTIDNIASRVNVLSLNAAIESTKAKKFERAFGEVSGEIRKLAKTANDSTQEAAKLLSSIQMGIFKADKLLKSDLNKIKESESKTEQTKIMLAQIRSAIQKEDNRVRKITQAIGEMQEASHQVGDGMNNVGYVSTKNTEAVKQVTLHNNELVTSLREISKLAQTLEKMAQSEEDLLAKFNVAEDN